MDIQQLVNNYYNWLKNESTVEKIGEWYEITTPFLDNANDGIQIYVRQNGDDIHFTDDGATLNNMEMHGIQLTSSRRKGIERIVSPYGIQIDGHELIADVPLKNYCFKQHLFIQAIIRVNEFYNTLSTSKETSPNFLDDVQSFFNENKISCKNDVKFIGKSGFNHQYDFLIAETKYKPDRFCKTLSFPSRNNVSGILFSWDDIENERKRDSQLIVILNDQDKDALEAKCAFQAYKTNVISWSERNNKKNIELLSA